MAKLVRTAALAIETPADFAHALLQMLGLPVSDNNVQALVAAQAVEGGHMHNAAMFNPLNTTWKMPGSHAATKVGVQSYNNWEDGLTATAKTFSNGLYKDIIAAFSRSAPPDETLKLPGWKTWGWDRSVGKAENYQSYALAQFPNKEQLMPTNNTVQPKPAEDLFARVESLLSKFVSSIASSHTIHLQKKAQYKIQPQHSFLIKVNANDIVDGIEFSRILCLALDEELYATASIHTNLHDIEVQCKINGAKSTCEKAITNLCSIVSKEFRAATKKIGGIEINTNIMPSTASIYHELSIKLAEVSYGAFHTKFESK